MQNTECIILQFPSHRLEERLSACKQGREWILNDFINVQKEAEELEGFNIVAFGNKELNSHHRYGKNSTWINEALLFDGKGEYARIWHAGERGDPSLRCCNGREARSLYHGLKTKLMPWRTLFPQAKPYPYERKYIDEPAGETGSAPG